MERSAASVDQNNALRGVTRYRECWRHICSVICHSAHPLTRERLFRVYTLAAVRQDARDKSTARDFKVGSARNAAFWILFVDV